MGRQQALASDQGIEHRRELLAALLGAREPSQELTELRELVANEPMELHASRCRRVSLLERLADRRANEVEWDLRASTPPEIAALIHRVDGLRGAVPRYWDVDLEWCREVSPALLAARRSLEDLQLALCDDLVVRLAPIRELVEDVSRRLCSHRGIIYVPGRDVSPWFA